MKRTRVAIGLTVVLALVLFLAMGCAGAKTGIEGTWVSGTSTVVITASTFNVTDTTWGTVNCTINNHDTGAGHLLMTVTSSSGFYAGFGYTAGVTVYALYKLNGDSLDLEMQTGSYPTTTNTTFTRQ